MGGEKTLYSGMQQVVVGSSPRWRGKDRFLATQSLVLRITPAWAGKRWHRHTVCNPKEDHPRVGGEKMDTSRYVLSLKGSPPRGRGKAIEDIKSDMEARITPAWAGKSISSRHLSNIAEDHPRVGGEKA